MITSPTCSQLVESVRNELLTKIKPVVTDAEALGVLAMMDSILASVAVRCGHEAAWINEEIAEIERGAEAVIAAGADRRGAVSAALQELRSLRSASNNFVDLDIEYQLAGEVLSRSVEAAMVVGGDLRETVKSILANRLAREVQIRGTFSLAGRE